ncbi:MAG: phosphate acetyltransferase [Candidatus Omnitrophica bacterium]|nr:phosphate acetyltransferase [Candidatus Omnitrophota bacterium]MBU0896573.1 phosphate acetyltransferase [Candidatus Omnitrophota bacterium]MBU1133961.1 phosphate acetyltransferase [Candidatus Omnitrophota bacterium]MBU1811046.1 phosphate acetyltransferase [Candidatus Omnitrophota bacterium]
MKKIIEKLRERAKKEPKRIVFPESADERIQEAAKFIEKEGIAYPCLLDSNNLEPKKQEEFAQIYYEKRKIKGITFQEARAQMDDPLYYSAMLVKCGYADGFIAGAVFTTSSVIKAAIRCLDVDGSTGFISSCFIIVVPESCYAQRRVFVFADCAVNPYPNSEQLAIIGISSAKFAKEILQFIPRVAFLSFSTKGSADNKEVIKIKEAVKIAKSKNSDFFIDGELQADSAIVPEVAKKKLADFESDVAGRANVLIFPNLDAGNICYKLTERLAGAKAIGPIILGTVQPCGDLSRGCSVEDIINSTAVAVVRAQKNS